VQHNPSALAIGQKRKRYSPGGETAATQVTRDNEGLTEHAAFLPAGPCEIVVWAIERKVAIPPSTRPANPLFATISSMCARTRGPYKIPCAIDAQKASESAISICSSVLYVIICFCMESRC
jgi:hypothetical protein